MRAGGLRLLAGLVATAGLASAQQQLAITSFFCDKTSYDVTAADARVTCYMKFQSSVGVDSARVSFESLSQKSYVDLFFSGRTGLVSGSLQAGTLSATAVIPRGAEQGTWDVPAVSWRKAMIVDSAGNSRLYTLGDFTANAFTTGIVVTSREDITAPTVTSLTCAQTTVTVTDSPVVRTNPRHNPHLRDLLDTSALECRCPPGPART
jgi:hypothetical protein